MFTLYTMSSCSTKTFVLNPHSDEIDKIVRKIEKETRGQWNVKFQNNTHEEIVDLLSIGFFTNLVQTSFTDRYMRQYPCSGNGCEAVSTQRCHGHNESRPELIRRALKKIWPDTSKPVTLRAIAIEFFCQHRTTKFTFKCYTCHKSEPQNDSVIAKKEATKARRESANAEKKRQQAEKKRQKDATKAIKEAEIAEKKRQRELKKKITLVRQASLAKSPKKSPKK